jgi:unsaturated rhamnogalacturonyl hydrolase
LRAYRHTKEPLLLDYSVEKFNRYLEITPRFRGCLVNFGVYPNNVRTEILWQVLPGIMLLARVTGDDKYARLAMDEYARLHELLFDKERNLWCHGGNRSGRSTGFWARGAAFSLLADAMLLEQARPTDPHYDLCLRTFKNGAASVAKFQRDDGFWPCVIDAPDSQPESSGAAWTAGALELGMRLGHLGNEFRPVADRAFEAVKSRIWQGDYPGHMVATTISKDRTYYIKRPLNDAGWSHFPHRAFTERLKRLK